MHHLMYLREWLFGYLIEIIACLVRWKHAIEDWKPSVERETNSLGEDNG